MPKENVGVKIEKVTQNGELVGWVITDLNEEAGPLMDGLMQALHAAQQHRMYPLLKVERVSVLADGNPVQISLVQGKA